MSAVAGTPNNPLNIFVKQGKFYQNPLGSSFTAPLQELLPADPLLQFDTFVTIGVKSDVFADTSDDVFVSAGFPPFENDSLSTNNGAWFVLPGSPNAVPDANGQVLIFQGSFIKDGIAKGIAGQMLLQFTSNGLIGQASVTFDHQIPAPGVLPLLALAGLMGTRRRRR